MIEQMIIKEIQDNLRKEEHRISELLKELRKDEEFRALEEKKDGLSFDIAKLESQDEPIGNLKSEYDAIVTMFNKKIAALNIDKNKLLPSYKCNICKDNGVMNGELCICAKNIIYERMTKDCGKRITDKKDFGTNIADEISEEFREEYIKVVRILEKYIQKFPSVKTLILRGKVGCGKTYLATIMANKLMKKGNSVLILDSFKMNEIFLNYHLCELKNKREVFSSLINCDLLVLDDLGSENLINNVTVSYLLELLITRDKPILVTTNLQPKDFLTRYDERIYSRLCGKTVCNIIEVVGNDLRNK